MATTQTVPVLGQIEWTGPTPTILGEVGDNLVGSIYTDLVQPTPTGAWGDESNDSWVEFEVSTLDPVQFGCASVLVPDPLLPTSGATGLTVRVGIAHSDITATTYFHPMLFDSREASIAWADTDALLSVVALPTSAYPGTYPAPPVTVSYPIIPSSGHGVETLAHWIGLINSGFCYAGFSYGTPDVSAVSTCRVFFVEIDVTYSGRKPPLRRIPPTNNQTGPTRHWPRPGHRHTPGSF